MATSPPGTHEKRPWLIPHIAAFIVWIENLVVTVSSLMLAFVAVTTVASAIHGGNLLEQNATLAQLYAWAQGIGIEGQLSGMAYEAMKAARQQRGWHSFAFWCITLVLAGAAFMAVVIVNYQQSFGVSFAAALLFVGISKQTWVFVRGIILIGLIVLAAAMRYMPAAQPVNVEQRLKELDDKQRIAEAQIRNRATNMAGGAAMFRQGFQALRNGAPPVASPASPAPAVPPVPTTDLAASGNGHAPIQQVPPADFP